MKMASRYGHDCLFLPDATTDTTRKRERKAQSLLGDGVGPLARLWALAGDDLYHLVIHFPGSWDFYLESAKRIKRRLAELLGLAPRYVFVARSRTGRIHAHILVHLDSVPVDWGLASGETLFAVRVANTAHFLALTSYLSRPHDERAAKPKPTDCARFTPEELALQLLDASEEYLEAKARAGTRHLPRLSWSSHIPALVPDLPAEPTEAAGTEDQPPSSLLCSAPSPMGEVLNPQCPPVDDCDEQTAAQSDPQEVTAPTGQVLVHYRWIRPLPWAKHGAPRLQNPLLWPQPRAPPCQRSKREVSALPSAPVHGCSCPPWREDFPPPTPTRSIPGGQTTS